MQYDVLVPRYSREVRACSCQRRSATWTSGAHGSAQPSSKERSYGVPCRLGPQHWRAPHAGRGALSSIRRWRRSLWRRRWAVPQPPFARRAPTRVSRYESGSVTAPSRCIPYVCVERAAYHTRAWSALHTICVCGARCIPYHMCAWSLESAAYHTVCVCGCTATSPKCNIVHNAHRSSLRYGCTHVECSRQYQYLTV